jgi:hypothetical protein
MNMSARNAETNLKCLFSIKMKKRNVRHAAQKNQPKKCLPLAFPQEVNSNHHQQALVHPARVAVHLIVQAVRK